MHMHCRKYCKGIATKLGTVCATFSENPYIAYANSSKKCGVLAQALRQEVDGLVSKGVFTPVCLCIYMYMYAFICACVCVYQLL